MKDKRLVLALGAAALVFAMVLVLAATPVALAKKGGHGGKGKITWSQNPVSATVQAGESFSTTVAFTSSGDLVNVTLDPTPSLQGTVVLSPTNFVSITAGIPYSVEISFTAPMSTTRAHFNGVVHLRTGHKNHPANLKLRFSVPVSSTVSVP
jgi:hypothetical protein